MSRTGAGLLPAKLGMCMRMKGPLCFQQVASVGVSRCTGTLPAELGRCRRMEAFSAFTNRLTAVPGALLAGLVECTRLSAPWCLVLKG